MPVLGPHRGPTVVAMAEISAAPRPHPVEPLWREALGEVLRRVRRHRRLTLTTAAARAGISPQYLSEIERGRKDPSSEIVAAVAGALGCTLVEVTDLTLRDLRSAEVDTVRVLRSRSIASPAVISGPVALAA